MFEIPNFLSKEYLNTNSDMITTNTLQEANRLSLEVLKTVENSLIEAPLNIILSTNVFCKRGTFFKFDYEDIKYIMVHAEDLKKLEKQVYQACVEIITNESFIGNVIEAIFKK